MIKYILMFMLLFTSQFSLADYQTYIQVDTSTQKDKYFILIIIEDEEWAKNEDIAQATFLLSPGESQQKVVKNKKFPDKEYSFSLSLEDKGRLLGLSEIIISDRGEKSFKSSQRFALSKQLSLAKREK